MKALDRKLLRDLARLKGQVVTIALVVACGVATFLTFVGAYRSLVRAEQSFYATTRFADVFASCKRAPEDLAPLLDAIPGVAQLETRVVVEATVDMRGVEAPIRGRLQSLPPGGPFLNTPRVTEGRLPAPDRLDEALVNEPFARAHGLRPGATVRTVVDGRVYPLVIAGLALSPEHVFAIAPGNLLHDDARFGIFWVDRRGLAAAFGMVGAFNDVALRLAPGGSERQVIARLDALLEPHGGLGAGGRDDQTSHHFVEGELEELSTWATLLPAIFVGVAAFLLNVVFSRLIGTQREQIAALKAFGYSSARVGVHYLQMIALIVVFGSALGTGIGWFLGVGLTARYAQFFRFPELGYQLEPGVVLVGTAITLLAAAVGGVSAVRAAVRLAPAEAMRPASPARYRRSVLEVLGVGWLLSNIGRIVVRNLGRRPLRTTLSIVGIGLSTSIVTVGLFFGDSLDRLVDHQFGRVMRDDMTVSFRHLSERAALGELEQIPGVLRAEGLRAVPTRLRAGHRSRKISVTAIEPAIELRRVLDIDGRAVVLPEDGLLLTSWLAEHLGVAVGDSISLEVLEGDRAVRVTKVTALADELFGLSAYMRSDALHRLLGQEPGVSAALLAIDPAKSRDVQRALKELPGVAGVTARTDVLASFESMTGAWMALVSTILSLFAATIAFGVVYNTARINLAERERELASLRVLGFTVGEITTIFAGELATLIVVGIPVGWVIARGIVEIVVRSGNVEGYRFPVIFEPHTLAAAALVVAGAGLLSALSVRRKLRHLDLVGVLKTRD